MSAVRLYVLKSGFSRASQRYSTYMKSTKFANGIAQINNLNVGSRRLSDVGNTQLGFNPLQSLVGNGRYRAESKSAFSNRGFKSSGLYNLHLGSSVVFPASLSSMSRSYSSAFGSSGDGPREPQVSVPSAVDQSNVDGSDVSGNDWVGSLKSAWQSTVDVASHTGEKAKEVSDELMPHFQQLIESHPYLENVVLPVGGTLTATLLAWLVMPRVLRKFHKYSLQSPGALLSGNVSQEQVPYEKGFWGALEDPVRYLVTFMAFSHIGGMIAPTTITSQYIAEAWRGGAILSFVWVLHRWKTNVFARAFAAQTPAGLDRERLLALDKLSSVGLFLLGSMALAEACGVAVQSVLTVGGIGGVATAFAARDILGNVLSGLSMQFSRPFSLGDTIKAGSIEGQVVEMGLTTTSLLNAEKFPVIVPNSLFSSQVIVNKSRALWRAMSTKIPLRIENLEKIPQITEDVTSMLKSNKNIFLGKESPYCFLSRIESSHAELTVGYNLNKMSKDELYSTEQHILLQIVQIISQHGASLGNTNG